MSATISANTATCRPTCIWRSGIRSRRCIPHVALFIHHGGNNSFNEALYFGKPAIIMPYCWDGLDNATRIDDTGYGAKLPRYAWTDEQFAGTIERLVEDKAMQGRLAAVSRRACRRPRAPTKPPASSRRSPDARPRRKGAFVTQAMPKPAAQSSAPHIYDAKTLADLKDWGVQPEAIEGQSRSSGLLLCKSGDQQVESGLWVCTPGSWRLSIPGDELCYFLSGRATYTEHNGETIEVTPGTVVHFPVGLDRPLRRARDDAQHLYAGEHARRPHRSRRIACHAPARD